MCEVKIFNIKLPLISNMHNYVRKTADILQSIENKDGR